MAIDFELTQTQRMLQKTALDFAQGTLKPVVAEADAEPDPQKAFAMMKEPYKEAYKLGFAMGFLPKDYGGLGVSNVDLQIVAEEICAVDPGFACILLVNGLALMPVAWYGSEKQKQKWIGEATSVAEGRRPGDSTYRTGAGARPGAGSRRKNSSRCSSSTSSRPGASTASLRLTTLFWGLLVRSLT